MENHNVALDLTKRFVNCGRDQIVALLEKRTEIRSDEFQEKLRISWIFVMRFVASNAKLNGNIEQCWRKYIKGFNQLSLNYNLSDKMKRLYIHDLLSKNALRFFLNHE